MTSFESLPISPIRIVIPEHIPSTTHFSVYSRIREAILSAQEMIEATSELDLQISFALAVAVGSIVIAKSKRVHDAMEAMLNSIGNGIRSICDAILPRGVFQNLYHRMDTSSRTVMALIATHIGLAAYCEYTKRRDILVHTYPSSTGSKLPYTLFTSIFSYPSPWYLLFSVPTLWTFGVPFCRRVGPANFLAFLTSATVISSVTWIATAQFFVEQFPFTNIKPSFHYRFGVLNASLGLLFAMKPITFFLWATILNIASRAPNARYTVTVRVARSVFSIYF